MAEEKTTKKAVKKEEKVVDTTKDVKKTEEKKVEQKQSENKETKVDEKKAEEKKVEKTDKKKKVEPKLEKKEKAIANAYSIAISPKQSKYICRMIRRKSVDSALIILDKIADGKMPVKMTGLEVPHQKGKGVAGARFPMTAAKSLAEVVKQLKANAVVNGIEEPVITIAMSNQASAPMRRGGRKSKRTHIHLEARENVKLLGENK